MGRTKLRTKLVIAGLMLVTVPLLALGFFTVNWASKALSDLERGQLTLLKQVVTDQVKIMLDAQTNLMGNASSNDAIIQETVQGVADTGVYDIVQFNLDVRTTVFHDKNSYEIYFMTDDKGKVIGDTSGGKYRKTDLSGEEYFKKALELNPSYAPAQNLLAWANYRTKDYEEATTQFQKAVALQPNDASLQAGLGLSLLYAKRYEEAKVALERALQLDPNSQLAKQGLAELPK